MTFDINKFQLSSAKVGQHGRGIDKANANAATDLNEWMAQCFSGILAGKLDLDSIKAQLIADYRLALPKAEQEDFDVDAANIGDCGSTVKGWFYRMQRIAKAGNDTMRRVTDNGEAPTSVMRDVNPVQSQASKGGKAKAKKADALPTLAASVSALNAYVTAALADNAKAIELASNAELATLVTNLAKLNANVDAVVQAQAA